MVSKPCRFSLATVPARFFVVLKTKMPTSPQRDPWAKFQNNIKKLIPPLIVLITNPAPKGNLLTFDRINRSAKHCQVFFVVKQL